MLFRSFTPSVRKAITSYIKNGGNIFISGQYVASDMTSQRASEEDKKFVSNVLGCTLAEGETVRNPRFDVVRNQNGLFSQERYTYNNKLNDKNYIVEKPDLLSPNTMVGAEVFMKFSDTDFGAAIIKNDGNSKSIVMSIPFEAIIDFEQRNRLMLEILDYFNN